MAYQISGNAIIDDDNKLVAPVPNLKTVNGESLVGTGDISVGSGIQKLESFDVTNPINNFILSNNLLGYGYSNFILAASHHHPTTSMGTSIATQLLPAESHNLGIVNASSLININPTTRLANFPITFYYNFSATLHINLFQNKLFMFNNTALPYGASMGKFDIDGMSTVPLYVYGSLAGGYTNNLSVRSGGIGVGSSFTLYGVE